MLNARSFILMVYLKYGFKKIMENMKPSPGQKKKNKKSDKNIKNSLSYKITLKVSMVQVKRELDVFQ